MLLIDLLIPDLLWPRDDAHDVMRSSGAPTLERWLARGTATDVQPISAEQWLWAGFAALESAAAPYASAAVSGENDLPLAPVTLMADGVDPGPRWWMRADPVHYIVGRTGLRLAPLDTLELSDAESTALAASINEHFDAPQFALLTPNAGRWYVGADNPFDLQTNPPARSVAQDVAGGLPRGPESAALMAFVNEVQMLWFDHPVNVERERRGQPVASSLWLHGAGRMPSPGNPAHDHTAGGGPLLAGLAALAGRKHSTLPPDAAHWLSGTSGGHWLVEIDALARCAQAGDAFAWRDALATLERDWFAPLDQALRSGALTQVTLVHPGRARLRTTRISATDRFRFWRKHRPLATHA
jgi:hypothetical protein